MTRPPNGPQDPEGFELYDLRVEVTGPPGRTIYCGARLGDYFELHGEMLKLPPGQGFSIYSLAALLPLLPAKQRITDPNDWMSTDAEVACPDPNCPTRFRITRTGRRRFTRSQVTATSSAARESDVIPRISLSGDYAISRIIKGGWHLAGDHGDIDPEQARQDMATFVDAGITTFDCADIYTGVERLIGSFRRAYPAHAKQVQIHTKFVPDLSDLRSVDRAHVEAIIDRSLTRLGQERLDLVQFHWWDFAIPRYVETALELDRLRRGGKIARIGVTNFDTPRLKELVDAGIPITSHQVQYSLVDDRPNHGMVAYCRAQDIALLCYGTVCGGFLSERWLGKPAPARGFGEPLIGQVQVDYRGFRRLGPIPRTTGSAEPRCGGT